MRRLPLTQPPLGLPFRLNRQSPQARGLVMWLVPIGSSSGALRSGIPGGPDGVASGAPSLVAHGELGQMADLGGTSDRYDVAHRSDLNITDDITITCWVYRDGTTFDTFLAKTNLTSQWDFDFYVQSGGQMTLYGDGCVPSSVATAMSTLTSGQLYHLAVTRQGSTVTFYRNGEAVSSHTMSGSFQARSLPVRIGTDAAGDYLDGRIGDTRLYNRALSGAEIRAQYLPQSRWDNYRVDLPTGRRGALVQLVDIALARLGAVTGAGLAAGLGATTPARFHAVTEAGTATGQGSVSAGRSGGVGGSGGASASSSSSMNRVSAVTAAGRATAGRAVALGRQLAISVSALVPVPVFRALARFVSFGRSVRPVTDDHTVRPIE